MKQASSRYAAVLLAAISGGQVEVKYTEPEPRRPDPPLAPAFYTIKCTPKRQDREKPWRRWPVRS